MLCDVKGYVIPPCTQKLQALEHVYDVSNTEIDVARPTDDLEIIFNEDFDTIDSSRWTFRDGAYRSKMWLPEGYSNNAYCENGEMIFRALRDNPTPEFEWSSMFAETKNTFTFQYGVVEARIKFTNASKFHATLWTLAAGGARGEIDIAEADSSRAIACTCHFHNDSSEEIDIKKSIAFCDYDYPGFDKEGYNKYTMVWNQDYIIIYSNDILLSKLPLSWGTINGFNSMRIPHYLVINTLPFTVFTDPWEAAEEDSVENSIDYLRVYSLGESGA